MSSHYGNAMSKSHYGDAVSTSHNGNAVSTSHNGNALSNSHNGNDASHYGNNTHHSANVNGNNPLPLPPKSASLYQVKTIKIFETVFYSERN